MFYEYNISFTSIYFKDKFTRSFNKMFTFYVSFSDDSILSALTSPTSGGRSVDIVRLRTTATEFCFRSWGTEVIISVHKQAHSSTPSSSQVHSCVSSKSISHHPTTDANFHLFYVKSLTSRTSYCLTSCHSTDIYLVHFNRPISADHTGHAV
jgi:hypothetical protein